MDKILEEFAGMQMVLDCAIEGPRYTGRKLGHCPSTFLLEDLAGHGEA